MFYVFSKYFVSGLYVYVRQAALSVDRAFGDNFQRELLEYHSKGQVPTVEAVLRKLQKNGHRKPLPIAAFLSSESICLTKNMREQIFSVLSKLKPLLSGAEKFTQVERMALRLELSHLETRLRNRLPNPLIDDLQFVEHYNQAGTLDLKSFQTIVGNSWPGSAR